MWKHKYHYAIIYHSAAPACFEFYTLLSWQRKAEAAPPLFSKNQMNPLLSKSLHNGFGMNEQGNVDLCRAVVEGTLAQI